MKKKDNKEEKEEPKTLTEEVALDEAMKFWNWADNQGNPYIQPPRHCPLSSGISPLPLGRSPLN